MASFRSIPRPWLIGAVAVVGTLLLLVAGNYAYWVGEGRPGTPEEFRDRVAASGLEAELAEPRVQRRRWNGRERLR